MDTDFSMFPEQKHKYYGSLQGKILVASRNLNNTCFEHALIYVCAHEQSGAIGVIINKQIGSANINKIFNTKVSKAVAKSTFKTKSKKIIPLYFGGPVEDDRLVILSTNNNYSKNNIIDALIELDEDFTHHNTFFNNNNLVVMHTDIEGFLTNYIVGNVKEKFIIAKGVVAWEGGQLEAELAENSWLIMEIDDIDYIFSKNSEKKWEDAVSQLGVRNFDNLVNYHGTA